MKLSTFILNNIEPILQEWESVTKTTFSNNQQTGASALREHAKQMLLIIAEELEHLTSSNAEEQAKEHGASRLEQGFTVTQMALEYQALRQSVMRLFCIKETRIHPPILAQLLEFNESIDRSLQEALLSYSRLKEQQTNFFNTMLSSSPDLNYILDLNGHFLYVNKAMSALYKQPEHQIIGTAEYHFAMPSAAAIKEHIKFIVETGKKYHGEILVKKHAHAADCFFEYVYAPIFDNQKIVAIAGVSRDITKQKKAEAKVWHYANYDDLTGLCNRRRFRDKIEESIQQNRRANSSFALFFIDLDKFKGINDKLGHDSGDLYLKEIAHRIRTCLRETDVVARIGGDEFAIILTNDQTAAQAIMIADKLLSQIRKTIRIKQTNLSLTASIGITLSPQDGHEANILLANADQAMYTTKKGGGNGYSFYHKDN